MTGSTLDSDIRALTPAELDQAVGAARPECHVIFNFKVNGVSFLGAYCDDGYWVSSAYGGGQSSFSEGRV